MSSQNEVLPMEYLALLFIILHAQDEGGERCFLWLGPYVA